MKPIREKPHRLPPESYRGTVKAAFTINTEDLLRNPVRRGLVAHWEHWPHRGVLGQTWEQLAMNIGTL